MDTHVTVAGNLTDHPELRFTPTGDQVCNLRVAVTARAPDGQGGWRDGTTSFFRVTVWRAQASTPPNRSPKAPACSYAGGCVSGAGKPTTASAAR